MDCRDIREWISAYVDGEASGEEARRVEEHLGKCGTCRTTEKRMRALGAAAAQTEGTVPADFRDTLFARMEREDLLPRRRSIFVFSVRWAAVPLAAAAALAFYVLSSRDVPRGGTPTAVSPPKIAAVGEELTPEDREIVANLEILEDPDLFRETDVEEWEILVPSSQRRG